MNPIKSQLKTIRENVENEVERLGLLYRNAVLVHLCREHNLTFSVSGWSFWFDTKSGQKIHNAEEATKAGLSFLVPALTDLNLETVCGHKFGCYISGVRR